MSSSPSEINPKASQDASITHRIPDLLEHFDREIESNPNNFTPRYLRAKTLFDQKRYKETLQEMKLLSNLKMNPPQLNQFYFLWGQAYLEDNQPNQALKSFNKLKAPFEDTAAYHLNIGRCYLNTDRYRRAIKNFEIYTKLMPDDHLGHFYKGKALRLYGKLFEAKACYKKAIEINDDFAPVYSEKGWVLLFERFYNESIKYFDLCLTLDPNCSVAFLGKAVASGRNEDLTEAFNLIDRDNSNLKLHVEVLLAYKGELYIKKGMISKAMDLFNEAFKTIEKSYTEETNGLLLSPEALEFQKLIRDITNLLEKMLEAEDYMKEKPKDEVTKKFQEKYSLFKAGMKGIELKFESFTTDYTTYRYIHEMRNIMDEILKPFHKNIPDKETLAVMFWNSVNKHLKNKSEADKLKELDQELQDYYNSFVREFQLAAEGTVYINNIKEDSSLPEKIIQLFETHDCFFAFFAEDIADDEDIDTQDVNTHLLHRKADFVTKFAHDPKRLTLIGEMIGSCIIVNREAQNAIRSYSKKSSKEWVHNLKVFVERVKHSSGKVKCQEYIKFKNVQEIQGRHHAQKLLMRKIFNGHILDLDEIDRMDNLIETAIRNSIKLDEEKDDIKSINLDVEKRELSYTTSMRKKERKATYEVGKRKNACCQIY